MNIFFLQSGCVVLLQDEETGKVFTVDNSGRRLWLSRMHTLWYVLYEPHRDKTNKMACVPSEDSDQPGHPPSLI